MFNELFTGEIAKASKVLYFQSRELNWTVVMPDTTQSQCFKT